MENFNNHFYNKDAQLPPGFRFHPTDEELITHYLLKKVLDCNFASRAIAEIDLNKCEPWELPGSKTKSKMGEKEWYFRPEPLKGYREDELQNLRGDHVKINSSDQKKAAAEAKSVEGRHRDQRSQDAAKAEWERALLRTGVERSQVLCEVRKRRVIF